MVFISLHNLTNCLNIYGMHILAANLWLVCTYISPVDPAYFETVKKLLHFGTVHKELVDPYCTVSFAGKKGETPVIWHDQEPKWNYQINLGIRVCEVI